MRAKRGKHSVGYGFCERVWHDQEDQPDHAAFDRVYELGWFENYQGYTDRPNTKVTNCLDEIFGLGYDHELGKYQIHLSDESLARSAHYLESIGCKTLPGGRYNAVCIHYSGNTSSGKKNASHETIALLCAAVSGMGYVPVILDWDCRSPLIDHKTVFNPGVHALDLWGGFGSGDAERIAALVQCCSLFVGIDSGPQKCAGATDTPSIGLWVEHHPMQFMDLCDNFIHLVPVFHDSLPPCRGRPDILDYFSKHYTYRVYEAGQITGRLIELAGEMLGQPHAEHPGLIREAGFWCRADNLEQDLVIVKDVYLQDCYKTALLPRRRPELVVDVGAHIGCFAKKWHELNPEATIVCVEACPENLEALRANVGDFATVLHGACTYEEEEVALLNAVKPYCRSTGGSMVVPFAQLDSGEEQKKYACQAGYEYWHDKRPLPKITLEEIMRQTGHDRIDVLKVDCEGSEYSILGKTPSLDRIGFVLGEYHDEARWEGFRAKHLAGWDYGHMCRQPDGSLGNFHYRNPVWPPGSSGSGCLKLAVPCGIGDSVWALTKVPGLLKLTGKDKAHITLCGGWPYRSQEFVERFDFVVGAEYSDLRCIEYNHTTPEGVFNWAPSQPNWHNTFDWMIQANHHLELGRRLEDYRPEWGTEWDIAKRFRFEQAEEDYAAGLAMRLGAFAVFFLGPLQGNTLTAHNRGGLWKPEDWGRLAHLLRETGLGLVIVGANWDRSYYDLVRPLLGEHEEYIGKWPIATTFAVLKRARCLISYQSGVGIFATYLGVPTAQFWRPHGDSVEAENYVSFSEDMASAWVPKDALESGRYLPCIYTRCSPESIMSHAKEHWLC